MNEKQFEQIAEALSNIDDHLCGGQGSRMSMPEATAAALGAGSQPIHESLSSIADSLVHLVHAIESGSR